ncbi:hypothetical protein [Okeania sp. KiyG1]|nr:hypothetical protein [Okeania sp. KiyG1]
MWSKASPFKGQKKIIPCFLASLYQFDKCLLRMVEVRKKEEGRRKKG